MGKGKERRILFKLDREVFEMTKEPQTYGDLIHEHLNKIAKLEKEMGYTVTEIIICTDNGGDPSIYEFKGGIVK